MRPVDNRKSQSCFLQVQHIRANPARFLDLAAKKSLTYCAKLVHSKAHSCLQSLHPWPTLHAHPSLCEKSCTHSSAPDIKAVVRWKKAAPLHGKATEQWRGHAKLFVKFSLSLRTPSLLRQWLLLKPKLMKSPGSSLHLAVLHTRLKSQKVQYKP